LGGCTGEWIAIWVVGGKSKINSGDFQQQSKKTFIFNMKAIRKA
jgi:hypothetical protein